LFNYTLSTNQNYSWNCLGKNDASSSLLASSNYTLIYDATAPIISGDSETVTASSATITWTTNEPATSSISGDVSSSAGGFVTSHTLTISGLSSSTTYDYSITSCDTVGNCATTTELEFTTAAASSGGGGGGSTSVTSRNKEVDPLAISFEELQTGSSRTFKQREKIQFTISNESHTLTALFVRNNSVDVLITSEPISERFFVGDIKQFNLSSPN